MAAPTTGTTNTTHKPAHSTALDKAREVRRKQSVLAADFSEERMFAIKQCQALSKVARISARKLQRGEGASAAFIRAAAEMAAGAIGAMD